MHDAPAVGDKPNEADRVGEYIVAETNCAAFRPGIDLLDLRHMAEKLDADDLQQMLDLDGDGSETVDHLGGEAFDLARILELGEAPVERHTDVQIGHIGFGDQHRGAKIDLRRPGVRDLLGPPARIEATASSSMLW